MLDAIATRLDWQIGDMKVKIALFAALRERLGRAEYEIELESGALALDAIARLEELTAAPLSKMAFMVAVNRHYVMRTEPLADGDELALIPPVSGGVGDDTLVELTREPLETARFEAAVRDPRCGATVVFCGTTRNASGDRVVVGLRYEAYTEMAVSVIRWIVKRVRLECPIGKVALGHRLGEVGVSEASVVLAVAAPRRRDAFKAAQMVMDELKTIVPIWKKELYEDGAEWV